MTITSTEIIADNAQADGRRHIGFKFVFHTGEEVLRRFWVQSDYDEDAGILAMKPSIETYMIEEEDSELMGQVEGAKLSAMNAEPNHPETDTLANRQKRLRRKILRKAMQEKTIQSARRMLYSVWKYLQDEEYTAQQIADYFDVSLGTLARINNRMQAIHDNLAFLDADGTYVGEVE